MRWHEEHIRLALMNASLRLIPSLPCLPNLVATALEAVIGAVYQDDGDAAVQRIMQSLGFFDHELLTVTSRILLFHL